MPLKVSDGIGAWIKDFKKSDAPQFKGKNEKERRDQAIAAYLSAKNEDVKSADKKPEVYTKPDGKRSVRMVPVDKQVMKSEKVVGYKTDPKLPNLKVPIKRKQGKIINLKKEDVNEDTTFKVNIEGLPMMFMSGIGSGDVKSKLRAIVKQPSMIKDVERVTDAEVRKNFRLKAQGRDPEENNND